jgi:RNA polymerase sigma-70 factor (ECF subfamily)
MTEQEFCEQYAKYKNTVYSVIFNYVQNAEDTADLLQEVFIKLYSTDTNFTDDEHRKAWLIRVSVNMCKNHMRAIKDRKNVVIEEDIPYFDQTADNELLKVVLTLPEKYRIPIHLFYYEDYSIKDIAAVLDLPESTVKIHLKRGRDKLSKILKKEDWF